MSLFEAQFKVKHECPYRTISAQHPQLTIREWFMNEHQILEVAVPETPTDELASAIDDIGTTLCETKDEDRLYAIVRSSLCSLDDSLISRFEAHNCLYMPPTVYREGWEHYTVTAFDEGDVSKLLGNLDEDRDIEVVSSKPIETKQVPHSPFMTTDSVFGGLTSRQLDALHIALDNGYFEQPRGASIKELANQTNVARSTFEEHLRKAENKVIRNVENHLRLLTENSQAGELRTTRRGPVST